MTKTARIIAAGTAVVAVALTGCSRPPAAAAVVNGVQIPNAQVDRAAEAIVTRGGADPATARRQVAFDLTLGEASRQIAERTGTRIAQADRDALLANQQAAQEVAQTPEGAPWGEAVTTTYLLLQSLGQDRFLQEMRGTDIVVNPQYGTWEPDRVTLSDASLSRAAGGVDTAANR